jgi:hypothetical protein
MTIDSQISNSLLSDINLVFWETLLFENITTFVFVTLTCNFHVLQYSEKTELDICESYNYLGILFHFNNNFVNAKKKLVEQAQHTLFSVYYKIRNIKIPLDLQWKIFDTLVFPLDDISLFQKVNIRHFISITSGKRPNSP